MKNSTQRLQQYAIILVLLLVGAESLYAQSPLSVSGKVTDEFGPLTNVSVIIKNSTNVTTTDIDGLYALNALSNDTLVFIHLGYKTQEIRIDGRQNIDIQLTLDVATLGAVELSGGYYSLDERTRTGNVTKVDKSALEQQVVHSPLEALQGRVAGLEVDTHSGLLGQAPKILIRGQSSLNYHNIPLYILDGVEIGNEGFDGLSGLYNASTGVDPLSTLDPSLIESIEILKDADATAIYGSKGANGVIIINTKRGQQGNTKFEILAETGVSWVGKFIKMMNTEQYLEMRREAFANDGIEPTLANAPDLLFWDQNRYTDWQKELFGKKAEFQKYQATLSGGNAQTSFLISGGFQKETTVFSRDFGFQNNNLLANINHTSLNNRLHLNTSINYGYRKSNLFNMGAFVNNAVILPPNAPDLLDETGEINWELDEHGNPTMDSPFTAILNPSTMRIQTLQWNGNITYNLAKGLNAKVNLGFNQANNDDNSFMLKRNMNPLFAETFKSMFNKRKTSRKNIIVEPQLHYKLTIGSHKISSLIGSTFQKNKREELSLRGQDYFSEIQVGNLAIAKERNILSDNLINYRYTALFGRIGYAYANKYFLNLTGRRDGSSRFGKNNRFGNFGAVGVAWEFYRENFIIHSAPWLSYGKLRGSYGTTGSDNIGDYQYLDTYASLSTSSGSLSSGGLVPSRLHNPYYQWEKNTKLEGALEIGLWEDRSTFTAGWYRERSGNQLIGLILPSMTGFNSIQGNLAATVQNTGWELGVTITPIQNKNFIWNSLANLTLPKNKLIAFPDLENSSYAARYEIGKSLGIQKFYHYTGIDQETGKYTFEDVNEDGVLNTEDQIIIADLSKQLYGGWNNDFQYKNWSFSFLFEFIKQKGASLSLNTPGGRSNQAVEVLDHWHNSIEGKYQAYTSQYDPGYFNYTSSDAKIANTSFIRLKSVSLQYRIPDKLLQTLKLKQAYLYLNGQNLFTLTSYKGLDPQSPGLQLPALTSAHLGIKLTL